MKLSMFASLFVGLCVCSYVARSGAATVEFEGNGTGQHLLGVSWSIGDVFYPFDDFADTDSASHASVTIVEGSPHSITVNDLWLEKPTNNLTWNGYAQVPIPNTINQYYDVHMSVSASILTALTISGPATGFFSGSGTSFQVSGMPSKQDILTEYIVSGEYTLTVGEVSVSDTFTIQGVPGGSQPLLSGLNASDYPVSIPLGVGGGSLPMTTIFDDMVNGYQGNITVIPVMDFGNYTLYGPEIPEPASLSMIALGGLAYLRRRMR